MRRRIAGAAQVIDYLHLFDVMPVPLLVMRARDLMILDANGAFLAVTGLRRGETIGRVVVDGFPARVDQPRRDQAVRRLLRRVADGGEAQRIERQRFDLPTRDGPEVHYWTVSGLPILTTVGGPVELVLQVSEDVTDLVRTGRLSDLRRAQVEASAERMAGLADTALALSSVETLQELVETVVTHGAAVVGSCGGMILTPTDDGDWEMTFSAAVEPDLAAAYRRLPYDSPLPACHVARTGGSLLLPDQASGLAFHPATAAVYARRPGYGWAFFPLRAGEQLTGALAVCWREAHHPPPDEIEMLEAIAAQCAQALQRLQAIATERRTARRVAELAQTLQRAMMTEPPQPPGLQVEVRYRTAVDIAQVGGDWYDAVEQPDGGVVLAIGDVCGHDHLAAATMGQMRALLRSLAFRPPPSDGPTAPYSAATVLSRFEELAAGLGVDDLATAVLARLEPPRPGCRSRRLSWSNAGNLPPVVIEADGTVCLLSEPADLLLGVDATTERHDHTVDLWPGSTLLLYTDGLIERRDASLDEGLRALQEILARLARRSLAELCDATLDRLVGSGEDDIALLAVRVLEPG